MKNAFYLAISATIALLLMAAASAPARGQHQHHGGQPPAAPTGQQGHQGHQTAQPGASGGTAKTAGEPHQALAMAYHESVAAFARALLKQVERAKAVDGEFARDAVTEMRRGFDLMERRHQDHMKTMSAEMRAQMDGMMKAMEPHHARIKELLDALERETGGPSPNPKYVTEQTTELLKHLDEMTGAHGGHQGHKT